MANGPPPSAAESSGSGSSEPSQCQPVLSQTTPAPSTSIPPYNYGSWWSSYPTATAAAAYPGGYSTTQGSRYNPNMNSQMYYPTQTVPSTAPQPVAQKPEEERRTSPTPPPPPPLEVYKHWDEAMKVFLGEAGLLETLKAFESDMLIMSSDWEEERIPLALQKLVKRLSVRIHRTLRAFYPFNCYIGCIRIPKSQARRGYQTNGSGRRPSSTSTTARRKKIDLHEARRRIYPTHTHVSKFQPSLSSLIPTQPPSFRRINQSPNSSLKTAPKTTPRIVPSSCTLSPSGDGTFNRIAKLVPMA
jgi:hypothetical protein